MGRRAVLAGEDRPTGRIDDHRTHEVHVADRDGIRLVDQNIAVAENSLEIGSDRRSIRLLREETLRTAAFR
jgi:hypothetical protein